MEANANQAISNKIEKKCIYVLALGGTISSQAKSPMDEFYSTSSTHINDILLTLPINYQSITIKNEQILQQISHEMTLKDLINIAKKINDLVNDNNVDGIVVSQGTNSIEETAYFISLVIKTKKSIIFTGSHRPLNSLGYDGNRNLYNAISLASSSKTKGLGVILTFNDCILAARDASKDNPSILGGFTQGSGLMGYIQGEEIHIHSIPHYKHTYSSEFDINEINGDPKIHIIYGHLGIDNTFVNIAIEQKAKGIISAGMGKGYQPKQVTESLIKASKEGILVIRCSRSGQGIVNREPNFDGLYGFIAGGSLSPQKARILLLVAMSQTNDRLRVQQIFDQY